MAAMAALKPIQYDPLKPTQIMAGIGNYRGELLVPSVLLTTELEDTDGTNVVGVPLGTSHNMVNAGVTHKFAVVEKKRRYPRAL